VANDSMIAMAQAAFLVIAPESEFITPSNRTT
jgi:hypothetical protein